MRTRKPPAHRWITTTYEGAPIAAYAEADAERLADLLPDLAACHLLLICDTAGFGNQAATVCIAGADAVLIPATPGEGDVVEAQRIAAYVAGLARSTRRTIPPRVLDNRIRRCTTLSRHALVQIEGAGLARFTSTLSEAVRYGELGFSGRCRVTVRLPRKSQAGCGAARDRLSTARRQGDYT